MSTSRPIDKRYIAKHGIIYYLLAMTAYSDTKFRNYRQEFKELFETHQALHDKTVEHVNAVSQKSSEALAALENIERTLSSTKKTRDYLHPSLEILWTESVEIEINFAALDHDSTIYKNQLHDYFRNVKRVEKKIRASVREENLIYNAVVPSWTGIIGLLAAPPTVHDYTKSAAYTIAGALMGTGVIQIYRKLTGHEEKALEILHSKLKDDMDVLKRKHGDIARCIHVLLSALEYYQQLAMDIFTYCGVLPHQVHRVHKMRVKIDRLSDDTAQLKFNLTNAKAAAEGMLSEINMLRSNNPLEFIDF